MRAAVMRLATDAQVSDVVLAILVINLDRLLKTVKTQIFFSDKYSITQL